MMPRPSAAAIAASLAFLTVLTAVPLATGNVPQSPRFERVALAPITIEPLPFEDASERPDQAEIMRRLSEEATKQAARILVRAHIAGSVERLTAGESVSIAPVLIRGTLRLPVSLPARVIGWDAGHRKGRFASVELAFTDARTGTVLSKGEATCDWNDAPWIYGSSHNRRNAPFDRVLEHFARKTTERAVWNAAKGRAQEKGVLP